MIPSKQPDRIFHRIFIIRVASFLPYCFGKPYLGSPNPLTQKKRKSDSLQTNNGQRKLVRRVINIRKLLKWEKKNIESRRWILVVVNNIGYQWFHKWNNIFLNHRYILHYDWVIRNTENNKEMDDVKTWNILANSIAGDTWLLFTQKMNDLNIYLVQLWHRQESFFSWRGFNCSKYNINKFMLRLSYIMLLGIRTLQGKIAHEVLLKNNY